MSYTNSNQTQPPITQQILEGVNILNRKLEAKGISVRFDYEDSLYYRDDSEQTFNYFSHQKIKHYGTARLQVLMEYEKLCLDYCKINHKKKFFTLQFLLSVIDKISSVQMKIADTKRKEEAVDAYEYPIRIRYNDLSCIILNQEEYNDFVSPVRDNVKIPLFEESIARFKIEEKIAI